ncbi:calcium:proton antiporter [Silvimonas iriomotensis]|uniref:Calcium:proton antiporter n=1 Tax=Silvimonas iriomotensis TaxID=449662 RepID=A0ABQ2PAL6_9NEIS|nr:calcium:proton antiporter [Silvimonas iriomotensis]GGP22447.1 calcium:proton antiporter [Silvimonas iriomotensis]
MTLLKQESFLLVAVLATVAAYAFEHAAVAGGQSAGLIASLLIIVAILLAALRVAHHAEVLAEKFGEPYGTMILTLSAVLVEVVILAIMTSHAPAPTLMRDTVYSAVMLDINGILGLAAILGGLKHGEQPYNVDSGNTYLVMILTAMGISMVVPEFIPQGKWQVYSIFTIVVMVLMYGMFLRLQTGKHSYFFSYKYGSRRHGAAHPEPTADEEEEHGNVRASAALLVVGIVLIGALAEVMSKTLEVGLAGTGVPPITAALIVAVISASPEILTALRSALANRMQGVVNIALGASLSTVILTVPVIEGLALLRGEPIYMALSPTQTVMMLLTLLAAAINLHDGETNAIEGLTHFVLFATFLMLAALGM